MNILIILIPVSLSLGILSLLAFLWTVVSSQYDDFDGAAERMLIDKDLKEYKKAELGPKINFTNKPHGMMINAHLRKFDRSIS